MKPTLRILDPKEFHQVAEVYAKVFTGPLPDSGWIVVAEFDGKVVGFSILQLIWHAEPTWVDASWRGTNLFNQLIKTVHSKLPDNIRGVLVTTADSKLVRVLTLLGLEHVVGLQTFRWLREK